jgi:hypothetical protein
MYGTVRRYEGIDKVRSEEVTSKVGESPLPALRKVPGFSGCYVFEKIIAGPVIAHESRGAAVTNGVPALA